MMKQVPIVICFTGVKMTFLPPIVECLALMEHKMMVTRGQQICIFSCLFSRLACEE